MFGFEPVSGPAGAATLIGVVLGEALALYVGYGLIESALGPKVARVLRGE
ncbi:MAG: hypothetical protein ABEI27_10315 [Halobellus sp.]